LPWGLVSGDFRCGGKSRANLNRDLREYGPRDAFRANLFYGKKGSDADFGRYVGNLPAHVCVPEKPKTDGVTDIRSGAISVRLHNTGSGADIIGMRDERTGEPLLTRSKNRLFTLLFRDTKTMEREYLISSLRGWRRVVMDAGPDVTTILFSDPESAEFEGISVALTAFCTPERNRISWELDVRNASKTLSLIRSEYPGLSFDVKGNFNTLCNQSSGRIRGDLFDAACHINYFYPSLNGCMQFEAAWYGDTRRGLYYGIHDPEGATKRLYSEIGAFSHCGNMSAMTGSLEMGKPKNSQKIPGTAVWQLFDGDWYDASQIYREWALCRPDWVPRITPEEGRADSPVWMRETPVWFSQNVGKSPNEGVADGTAQNENWADELIEAQKDMDVPVAAHIYNWRQIPFDNDYPHYKPARLLFIENIERLHESGIKIMPYINGRLWDTHDRREKDWKFTKEAAPSATTTHFGTPFLERYASKEVDGSPVTLAPMCPTTAVWQEKQKELCDWLMNELDVDAVYLDQIAAADPLACMNENHAHSPGNGSWWRYAYYNLMEHIRRITPPERGYTTECNSEVYMRAFDSYLTWHWVVAGQAPVFPAVYAGYIGMFGRCYSEDTSDHLRILAGQSLLFGEQIGWISPAGYLSSPYRALFRKIVRTRYEYTRYFAYGRMLRPPGLTGDIPLITSPCHLFSNDVIVWPAAAGALWQRNDTGERALFLENLSDAPLEVDVRADLKGETSGRLKGDLSGEIVLKDGKCGLTLPAQAIVVVELLSKK
jgi:hypothetical protein